MTHRQGKLHNNVDALSCLPYTDCESDICSNSDVFTAANTSLLPVYSPHSVRTTQLQDNLVGPFLRTKETGHHPYKREQSSTRWYNSGINYSLRMELCIDYSVVQKFPVVWSKLLF